MSAIAESDPVGFSPLQRTPLQVDCVRKFSGKLPFVGTCQKACMYTPQLICGQWNGVQCTHSNSNPSPHLTGTHIESKRHIDGSADTIHTVLGVNSRYESQMEGLLLRLQPEEQLIEEIFHPGAPDQTISFSNGETYEMPVAATVRGTERIISRAAIEKALQPFRFQSGSMLFLAIDKAENDLESWPYLTNEAVRLINDLKVSILGINMPSLDREKDGGKTSNHKLFFSHPDRLIIESAQFHNLPSGSVLAALKIDYSSMDVDCASLAELKIETKS